MQHKITALRYQKRNRHRVNVYLDGQYAFAVQDTIAGTLRVGQELSADEVTGLQGRDVAEAAYERVLNFLSYRPRSKSEVWSYLKRRAVPEELIPALIERLQTAGLLDDEAFARYWVENRESFRPRGARSLRFELRRKGVDESVANEAAVMDAMRAGGITARRMTTVDYATFRRRLDGFLQRRGFGYSVSKEVVNRLWHEIHPDEGTDDADQALPGQASA